MDEARLELARQWLAKARRDLTAAERLRGGQDPLLDVAVYHCQQAAEKALKAYLAWCDLPVPKTHDLIDLLERCQARDPAFASLHEAAEALTPYSVAFRYPGDVLEPDPADADEALAYARTVLAFVVARLPEAVRPA